MAGENDPKIETEPKVEPKADPIPEPKAGDDKANAAFAEMRQKEKAAREEAKAQAAKAAELEAKLAEIERAKLTEDEKLRKDLADFKPRAEQADRYTAGIKEILDIEIADVPEDKRDLVPDLDPLEKLKWVRSAKAKGLFAPPAAPLPAPKPGAAGGSPPPGNGAGDADAALKEEIAKARKSGNHHALVAAMRRAGK